jgi:hypothetical protein
VADLPRRPPSDVSDEKYYNDTEKHGHVQPILPLGAPIEDKRGLPFWERFKRVKYDNDAIATQESVYDDPVLSKYYAPRPE